MSKSTTPEEQNKDLKKYFDETQYSTLIIDTDTSQEPKPIASNTDLLIAVLVNNKTTEQREGALRLLKEKQGQPLLIHAITQATNTDEKAKLIAACWETGLEFNAYFDFFVELVCDSDYFVALEAYTVIENTEGIIDKVLLEKSLQLLNTNLAKNPNNITVQDCKSIVERHIELSNISAQ